MPKTILSSKSILDSKTIPSCKSSKIPICQIKTYQYNSLSYIKFLNHSKYDNLLCENKIKQINNENIMLGIGYLDHLNEYHKTIHIKNILNHFPNFKNVKELFLVDPCDNSLPKILEYIGVDQTVDYNIHIIRYQYIPGYIYTKIEAGQPINENNNYELADNIINYINENFIEEQMDVLYKE